MQQWQRNYDLALMEWNSQQVGKHVCSKAGHTLGGLHCMPTLFLSLQVLLVPHIAEEQQGCCCIMSPLTQSLTGLEISVADCDSLRAGACW